jgi:hypothetical protein
MIVLYVVLALDVLALAWTAYTLLHLPARRSSVGVVRSSTRGGSHVKAGSHDVTEAGWYVFDDFDVWGPYAREADAMDGGSLEANETFDGGPLQIAYVDALPVAADLPRIMDERATYCGATWAKNHDMGYECCEVHGPGCSTRPLRDGSQVTS